MVIFLALAMVLTVFLVLFAVRLQRSFRRFTLRRTEGRIPLEDLPTISVCIPARNEMHAMTQCLERVLASDYEKLEVIVYDDRSKDDTSILIRSFAHAGVRFVPGTELPSGWLGRNHALEILASEASGEYLVFLDVDTFIKPTTISQLVSYMIRKKLKMISVIPGRSDTWRASVFFGHLRYFWELLLSRESAPATSTSVWVVHRTTLSDLGGFAPYKNNVQPESQLASMMGTSEYHCILSDKELGVTFEKKWHSQVEAAKRLLYPMAGGTWQRGALALVTLVLLNLPFFTVMSSVFFGWTIIQIKALWLLLAFMALYGTYTNRVWRNKWWLGGLLWPIIILQELVLLVLSMWGYARGTITWKRRPVTAAPLRVDAVKIDT
jgi:glycosyltransferase involved in cell wall biosynthesis